MPLKLMPLKFAFLALFFTQAAFASNPFVFPKHGNIYANMDWLLGPQIETTLVSGEPDPKSASVVTLAWSREPGLFRLDFNMKHPDGGTMPIDTFGWKQSPPGHFHSCMPNDTNCSCLPGETQCPCRPGQANCNPTLMFTMPSGAKGIYQACLVLHPYASDFEQSCQDLPADFVK